jgi:hypothetical protein
MEEGFQVIQTRGWTAFSSTSTTTTAGSATAPAAADHTGETTEEEDDSDADTDAEAQAAGPAVAISTNDQFLFSDPARLLGETLLTLAERYTNSDILKHIGLKPGTTDQPILAQSALSHRIILALEKRAKATNTTAAQARSALKTARAVNNVQSRAPQGTVPRYVKKAPATPAAATTPTPAYSDQHLFTNSELLFGETLLNLAEKYSNSDISKNVSKKFGTDQTTIGDSGVSLRTKRALKARAIANNITFDQAKEDLKQARLANGITLNNKGVSLKRKAEPASQAGGAAGSNKKKRVEPAPQADAATTPESADTEMADSSSGDSQEGYTADEIDAANALLLMFQTPPQEVIDAANILMTLNKEDGAETEDEVSDTEMDDAQKAEFMADFQKNWRPETQM